MEAGGRQQIDKDKITMERRGADSGLGWPVTPSQKDCHIT